RGQTAWLRPRRWWRLRIWPPRRPPRGSIEAALRRSVLTQATRGGWGSGRASCPSPLDKLVITHLLNVAANVKADCSAEGVSAKDARSVCASHRSRLSGVNVRREQQSDRSMEGRCHMSRIAVAALAVWAATIAVAVYLFF